VLLGSVNCKFCDIKTSFFLLNVSAVRRAVRHATQSVGYTYYLFLTFRLLLLPGVLSKTAVYIDQKFPFLNPSVPIHSSSFIFYYISVMNSSTLVPIVSIQWWLR
jgi:hypothetical protein